MGRNAKTFKPGEVNNPHGRPKKGYSITEMMKELLSTKMKDKNGVEFSPREAIGKSIMQKALQGNTAAQKMVWQYMDGMPLQSTDMTSGGEKLQGVIVYKPEKDK